MPRSSPASSRRRAVVTRGAPRGRPGRSPDTGPARRTVRGWSPGVRRRCPGRAQPLPEDVRSSLEVHLVEDLDEVLTLALRGARFEAGHLVFDGDAPVEPSLLAKHN